MNYKNKSFKSINEFERHFFPRAYEKKLIEKMTPEQLGEYWAGKTLKNTRKMLQNRKI